MRDAQIKDRLKIELRHHFQLLSRDSGQKVNLDDFNKAVCETGEKILGFKKKNKKNCVQVATTAKIEERRKTEDEFYQV